ncbi:hypothetical protein [Bdellovibrio sp. HCB337]|uniref:hypothetical protein n=1 Tax=Bdellovibrio sp. HCB337 TaxID=3394358 RepID=UPI0039A521EC
MLRIKIESILLIIAILFAGAFAYRYFQRPLPGQSNSQTDVSHSVTPSKPAPQAYLPSAGNLKPPAIPPKPVFKQAGPGAPQQSHMAKYQQLLDNPQAGLERLDLLDKMKTEISQEELSLRAYYETLTGGPAPEYSKDENHQRRNAVSIAFGMYLDSCQNFDTCYKYAVAALARYPDQEMFDDLYLQVQHKYPQDWQRDLVVAEMKKYGITFNKKPTNK